MNIKPGGLKTVVHGNDGIKILSWMSGEWDRQ